MSFKVNRLIAIILSGLMISCGSKTTKWDLNSLKLENDTVFVEEDKQQIKELFYKWQIEQVKKGNYLSPGDCYMGSFYDEEGKYNEGLPTNMGFPDFKESYNYLFTDLNGDMIQDGLITFPLSQCDGGNGSDGVQDYILFLSNHSGYSVLDTMYLGDFQQTEMDSISHIYHIDSVSPKRIYATFYGWDVSISKCCPDIERKVTFDFKERKLISISENLIMGDY